jgi:hypothetical protein
MIGFPLNSYHSDLDLWWFQVNRFLRQLTTRKQLWIALVEDLAAGALIDLPQSRSLADYSVQELIELVKRTVTGPVTWSREDTPPTLAEEILLPECFLRTAKVELLPGGRYILALRESSLELWNVNGTIPIWTTISDLHTIPAFEVAGSGSSVVIFLRLFLYVSFVCIVSTAHSDSLSASFASILKLGNLRIF